MNRSWLITAVTAAILLLALLLFFLLKAQAKSTRQSIRQEILNSQSYHDDLAAAKEVIQKDIEEKYKADIVSYNAMAKRVELQKQKIEELEKKSK
jgi:Tfp pilus assembly protein PilN